MNPAGSTDPAVAKTFDQVVSRLDYPMFIATVAVSGEADGCLVGFATQSSIDPPRFLVCVSNKNRTYRLLGDTDVIAVHVVPEDRGDLVELFGGETGDEVDKLERCEWRAGPEGVPLLEGCGNRFAGRVLERMDCGDHVAFLLDPFFAEAADDHSQYGFRRAMEVEPGHEA